MTKILMSKENPEGHKLEDLLVQVSADLGVKNEYLNTCSGELAGNLFANNVEIQGLLKKAEEIQLSSMALLDAVGVDNGPKGKSRI